tara:strand:- start:1572 stop:1688 length:117 start_codon:yes stop_codon:yes gene_type:complete
MQEYYYSLDDLNNMLPWEREIFVYQLVAHLREKNQQNQ